MKTFVYRSQFSVPVEDLFRFHEEPIGFETLVGSSPGIKVIQRPNSIQVGEEAIFRVPIVPGLRVSWKALHTAYIPNELFRDEQVEGPFRRFVHSHIFTRNPLDSNSSILEDRIEFEAFFPMVSDHIVPIMLGNMFRVRHSLTARALESDHKILFRGVIKTS